MENNINSKLIQDRIAVYQASLKEWDAKLDQFDAKMRIEYENERDGFTRELAEAWKDLTEAKLDEYSAQIEGSYQKLKAKWHETFDGKDSSHS
jgi:predicted nuclease with TOPRIM domain